MVSKSATVSRPDVEDSQSVSVLGEVEELEGLRGIVNAGRHDAGPDGDLMIPVGD
jgi:hypothetical protein